MWMGRATKSFGKKHWKVYIMKHVNKIMWFWKATKTLRKTVNRWKPLKDFQVILWKPLNFLKLLDHRWLGIMKGAYWPLLCSNIIWLMVKASAFRLQDCHKLWLAMLFSLRLLSVIFYWGESRCCVWICDSSKQFGVFYYCL